MISQSAQQGLLYPVAKHQNIKFKHVDKNQQIVKFVGYLKSYSDIMYVIFLFEVITHVYSKVWCSV